MATKKTKTKAKQHTEAELLLFKNYSLSSSTLSSKVNKYSKKCTKQVSLFKRGFIININENEDQYEKQISNKITLVMKGMYWYSFVTNYWGKGSNKLHQGENYQDLLKWVGGSFGHSLIIKRIWGFFPKICNWTPSPIFWYKKNLYESAGNLNCFRHLNGWEKTQKWSFIWYIVILSNSVCAISFVAILYYCFCNLGEVNVTDKILSCVICWSYELGCRNIADLNCC